MEKTADHIWKKQVIALVPGTKPQSHFRGEFIALLLAFVIVASTSLAIVINQPSSDSNFHSPIDYSKVFSSVADANAINASLTGWSCGYSLCNFSIIIDNDGYGKVSLPFGLSNFNVTQVMYKLNGIWSNITELSQIGQGGISFNSSHINVTLAGGDGYDFGLRDVQQGGSYWVNETGGLYGKVNISNDFISVSLTENETVVYNSSFGRIFNYTFNDAVKADNQNITSVYGTGTQNKTVYFFDWNSQTWKVWARGAGNATHGTPDWLDPRNKQEFKWKYAFSRGPPGKNVFGIPEINITFLMTAHDPFVRAFVDTKTRPTFEDDFTVYGS
ncbi:MAG: hypothetical protein HZB68_05210, partial [Candidatus Aenigmarchaeota archaeon]|nr:hypothetical protein [Candidatus Aenigmarchaeota archaeon]